jgi:two-component system, OmpR family, phosphate regulon response regulator PhoB
MNRRPEPHVLICDDEPSLRELVRVSLHGDYRFSEAHDGNQSIELARKMRPDLVILDLMMPGRSGLDVLAEIRADPDLATMRVIVLTAQPESIERALELGADEVIVKPFMPGDLATTARALLP